VNNNLPAVPQFPQGLAGPAAWPITILAGASGVDLTSVTDVTLSVHRQVDETVDTWAATILAGASAASLPCQFDFTGAELTSLGLYDVGVAVTLAGGQTLPASSLRLQVLDPHTVTGPQFLPSVSTVLYPKQSEAAVPSSAEEKMSGNATPTVCTLQNVDYEIAGAWSHDLAPQDFTVDDVTGHMTCQKAGRYWTVASLSFTSPGVGSLAFSMFKNGAPIPGHKATTWISTNTYPNSVSISGIDDLVPGDVLSLMVRGTTGAGLSVTVTDANFGAMVG
jgi:hypothetical protein